MRRRDQDTVEVIRPAVIRAYDHSAGGESSGERDTPGGRRFIGCAAQPRAAMPADIIKGAQLSLAIAHHEDALAEQVEHQRIARILQLLLAADADPFSAKDAFLLGLK